MPIIATVWSLTLLVALAISLSFTGTISYRLAQNSGHGAHDESLVDAGINWAVLGLLDPRARDRRLSGINQDMDFGGMSIRVHTEDELGKIDLNQTDGSTLVALFHAAGVDPLAAEALTDKVLDWREDGPVKRLNGAKADEYRAAGYDYVPRNGPFQSVDELALVMGMASDLYRWVAPALTVYSGRQFVDPEFAPPQVLAALPSLAAARTAAIAQSAQIMSTISAADGLDRPITALKGRAYTVDVAISRSPEAVRYHSVVRLTGDPADPFWILLRQRL